MGRAAVYKVMVSRFLLDDDDAVNVNDKATNSHEDKRGLPTLPLLTPHREREHSTYLILMYLFAPRTWTENIRVCV